jgi:hypothetical protein
MHRGEAHASPSERMTIRAFVQRRDKTGGMGTPRHRNDLTGRPTGRPSIDPHAGAGEAPTIGTRIPRGLLVALDAEATRRGLPRSVAVREALAAWIDRDEAVTA